MRKEPAYPRIPLLGLETMPYEVQTPVFEGAADLLLHLILKQHVALYDINLSQIVDEHAS